MASVGWWNESLARRTAGKAQRVNAYCPEIPGANGQGHTKEEARRSLSDAIALILAEAA